MAQSLLSAGVYKPEGGEDCVVAENKSGLNSIMLFLQSLTYPNFVFDHDIEYDPDVEVAIGTTFAQYIQDGFNPLPLLERQLQNQNYAAFYHRLW